MAPAMLAPAMMAKAEGIASTIAREMRQEICVLHFNEDLDVVGPGQKYAFKFTITPALISSIGALALGLYIAWCVKVWSSNKDPWGNAPENTQELLLGKLMGGGALWQ